MANRRVEGSVSRRERFEGAHEIGKREGAAPALAVSRLIEPDYAIPAGEERCDEAPELHAPAAPAMDQQNRWRPERPGLPDGKRARACDDGFAPCVDRLRPPARVAWRHGEQPFGVAGRHNRRLP